MSEQSQILSLPYILPSQAQKHVTHNEAVRKLDAVVQLAVNDLPQSAPPTNPASDMRYIVGPSPTGAWAGQADAVALYADGYWTFYAPVAGWHADVLSTGTVLRFDGTQWASPAQAPLQNLGEIGVNTTADSTNRLSVSAEATLLNHEGAGHQLKLNKANDTDTASLLFQTGFSGRAEMGTAGNDDFTIKVSPDGASFSNAMIVDAQTAQVIFPYGSPNFRERLVSDRTYHVRLDGDDTNDGLSDTAQGAFASIQRAIDVVLALDCGIYDVTIEVGAGDFDETIVFGGPIQGTGTCKLVGDAQTPANVKVKRITCQRNAIVLIEGFEFKEGNGLDVRSRAQVTLRAARFTGSGSALSLRDGFLDCSYATLEIAGSITSIATMYNYANFSAFGATFDLDANVDWGASGAFYMRSFCLAWLQSAQFTGGTATCIGRRYNIGLNSVLNTATQSEVFLPGDTAGLTSSGSQYQ